VVEQIERGKVSNVNADSKLKLQKPRVISHICRLRRNPHKNKLQILGALIANDGYRKDEIKRRISGQSSNDNIVKNHDRLGGFN